jgi:hypothetical protein
MANLEITNSDLKFTGGKVIVRLTNSDLRDIGRDIVDLALDIGPSMGEGSGKYKVREFIEKYILPELEKYLEPYESKSKRMNWDVASFHERLNSLEKEVSEIRKKEETGDEV